MATVIIRPSAEAEIDDLAQFMATDNMRVAERFLRAARATFRELLRTPRLGRPWESDDPRLAGIRVWPVTGFRDFLIFYRPGRAGIEILHVFHGARDISALLDSQADDL